MTNTSAFGYLSGLTSALFTAFAIENISINKWPFLLIDILNSKDIKKYIGNNDDEKNDHNTFINYWMKYIDDRFQDGKVIKTRAHVNLIFRAKFHFINFTEETIYKSIGESGFGAVIMAYDSLLDAGKLWEKLIIYSTLHFGDGSAVGALAASWHGAIYGFENVPKKNVKKIEKLNELKNIGEKLYSDRHKFV
jgi:ADP-ribosylarginine hydrolase